MTPNWNAAAPYAVTADQQRAEVGSLCAMHANLTRFWVSWHDMEPAQGRFDPTYTRRVDQVMRAAAACHIKVILTVSTTPRWASGESGPVSVEQSSWSRSPPLPGLFQSFVARLLARYPRLHALEVWNEPNLFNKAYFAGSIAQYASLVNEAVAGRNEARSHTRVIAGALLGMGGIDYLEQLYAAGMSGQDGISMHPYSRRGPDDPASNYLRIADTVHAIMQAHNDGGGIWFTEFGYVACPATPHCQTPETQAAWLVRAFKLATTRRYIAGLTAFSVRDVPWPDPTIPFWDRRMGTMTTGFQRRPAWFALRKMFRQRSASIWPGLWLRSELRTAMGR